MTTGVIVRAKKHRLGWTVFTHLKDSRDRKEEEARISAQTKRLAAIGHREGLLAVLALNVSLDKWGVNELKDILRFLKTREDGPMPKSKKDLWAMYHNLRIRSELLMNYVPGAAQNAAPDPEEEGGANGHTAIHVQEGCMVQPDDTMMSDDENTEVEDSYWVQEM